jgi:flagellar protein FlgJ
MTAPLLPTPQIPAAASAANTYTDISGLASLKKDSKSPEAIHAIAQQVDALFLQMMLKSMRDASADQGEADSNEMGMYQDMFDKQIALNLSQHQGLGLGSLLTRQLSAAAAAAAPTAPAATASPAAGAAVKAPAAGPPISMLQTASQFVSQVLPSIRTAAQSLGVSPMGLLAQAALETGWGKRMPRTADGAPSLNVFGIKADESWDGARASASTVEFDGGVATQRHAAFRAYGSIEESASDFANMLKGSPRYAQAIAAGANAQAYVEHIGQSGYATDPQYTNKLNEILNGSTLRLALNLSGEKL